MKVPLYIRKQVDGKRQWIKVGYIDESHGYFGDAVVEIEGVSARVVYQSQD